MTFHANYPVIYSVLLLGAEFSSAVVFNEEAPFFHYLCFHLKKWHFSKGKTN